MPGRKGLLERLTEGPVVGDGSMCFLLEKRGYAKAGAYTPEAVIEYPDAVLQLHREYVRAGADVVQTASFSSSDDKLTSAGIRDKISHTTVSINDAAYRLARKAADENGALVAAGVSPVLSFRSEGNDAAREEFAKQVEAYRNHDIDFVIAEFFHDINEIELCATEMAKLNVPMALCMRIGVNGDLHGVSVEECAVRMAKTGARLIGTNCAYDPSTTLKVMRRCKSALDREGLNPYLICQPVGFLCPEVENHPRGFYSLPEYPISLDPRIMTRIEAAKFAREAYESGVQYIGGCCGFEPHHIRGIAQELAKERGKEPPVHDMARLYGGEFFEKSIDSTLAGSKTKSQYWKNLNPASGRPFSPAVSKTFVTMKPNTA